MASTTRRGTCADDPHIQAWFGNHQWSIMEARRRRRDDPVGALMVTARGEVRWQAAHVLRNADSISEATKTMLRHTTELRVLRFPLITPRPFTLACQYVRARTWQDCAHQLDPTLPTIQPAELRD